MSTVYCPQEINKKYNNLFKLTSPLNFNGVVLNHYITVTWMGTW